jgi:light-regulated signal transduction histidine kinase (bacteriophytochrome)
MLSQVTRREVATTSVDMSEMAADMLAEFRRREPARRVQFVAAAGLVATTDRHLIRIALENLLGNAWKFTGKRGDAEIELGACVRQGKHVFFVRDNGVGFDMAYADKLFGAFQRMHGSDEFPGTGIGLATVQRVMHRLGGQVWAEAAVDRGATFYFSLSNEEETSMRDAPK